MDEEKYRTIIIGITGGFGTGKTTVAKAFKALGAKVLDADRVAHKALKRGAASYEKIVKVFGRHILNRFKKIDRAKLAHRVFRNKKSLSKLCGIIHPIVIAEIKKSIKKISDSKSTSPVVIDAPLLIEARLHNITDYLIVVKTSRATQIKRAMRKTGFAADEIIRRIKSQIPLNKKIQMADYVIDNEGRKNDIKKIVKKIWEEIENGRE